MLAALGDLVAGARRIAMNYSPRCAIPYVARVDAGTVEIVRSLGVEIVSAADLIQRFEARLEPSQLESHRRAAALVRRVVDETFAEIARAISAGAPVSEYSAQQFVLARFAAHGLVADDPPIVAVNANAARPHFEPSSVAATQVRRGDLVLLDLWAKEPGAASIYADLTWMAYTGGQVPEEYARVFAIVAEARDAAVDFIRARVSAAAPVRGEEADRVARGVVERAGFAEQFVHRTGHSIGREVHGAGANLDSLETHDHRALIDRTCFSVEPGIYLPGHFGIRSELDMTIEDGRAEVSAAPAQREIVALLK
jgi:Xaa-Pro aminopeptidase